MILSLIIIAVLMTSCTNDVPEPGVSISLAHERSELLSDVSYSLEFDLTAENGNAISNDTIRFCAMQKKDVVLDFKAPEKNILDIEVNGIKADISIINEHLIIPRQYINDGDNSVAIKFIAGEQSLNRREDFLYTLLVPDRARTLFPCFDQPDLKAIFKLTLNVPYSWVAISNTNVEKIERNSSTIYHFRPTQLLSTYLFSFVAGRFEKIEQTDGGRTVSMYHRETDSTKIGQSKDIFNLVFSSLAWLEEYTGIEYPFSKYDFIVLPDFQYGGMEHAGATLYNDKRLFLGPNPTTEELLERASLIAHETSHMWFGDYVTMRWFDDVWTKEVFANWFAARIMRPLFPSINHDLSDLINNYASAYSEDRTRGSNAIHRPLDNLQDAGLIYCNIIYDKAPIVMNKLVDIVGELYFREGMRKYLQKYGYSNATWDNLVEILDQYTDIDLRHWSKAWIEKAGMPTYTYGQQDGLQELKHEYADSRYWIPNIDGKGYGWFKPDSASMEYIMVHWGEYGETARMSLLMTLYENSWHGTLDRKRFIDWCCRTMIIERNPLIYSSVISYAVSESIRYGEECPELSATLRSIAMNKSLDNETRLIAFRQYVNCACTKEQLEELYAIWYEEDNNLNLSEKEYTDLACQLMIAFPERYTKIVEKQSARITNPDRKETFAMLCIAASPDITDRKALFFSFLESARNRRPESRILTSLSLLCHKSRKEESLAYIIPSLDSLSSIQRTGDIFFPASWCKVILKNQQNENARAIVDDWLASHPNINPLLATKILQASN